MNLLNETGQMLAEKYLRYQEEIIEACQKLDHYKSKLGELQRSREECIREMQKLVGENVPTKAYQFAGKVVVVDHPAGVRVLTLEEVRK